MVSISFPTHSGGVHDYWKLYLPGVVLGNQAEVVGKLVYRESLQGLLGKANLFGGGLGLAILGKIISELCLTCLQCNWSGSWDHELGNCNKEG